MILRIKEYFESRLLISETNSKSDIEHKLKLACAVLMLEIIHVDENAHEDEEQKIRQLLQQQFDINKTEIEELLSIAHEKKNRATDYHQFTSLINQHYSQQQKITLIEHLWHIAYADNRLDKFEEHLIRRLAELLHVPHRHFIQSKHRATDN